MKRCLCTNEEKILKKNNTPTQFYMYVFSLNNKCGTDDKIIYAEVASTSDRGFVFNEDAICSFYFQKMSYTL